MQKNSSGQHWDVQLHIIISIFDAVLLYGAVVPRDMLNGICATDMENWRNTRNTNDKFAMLSGLMSKLRADGTLLAYKDKHDQRVFVYEANDTKIGREKLRSHLFYIINLEDIDLWCLQPSN